MGIVNLCQAIAQLGFNTTTTLRRLLQSGELDAYLRSGPDLRETYLDIASKGMPTLRKHLQSHTECRGNSPVWVQIMRRVGRSRIGIGLISPRVSASAAMGATTVDRAAVGDAAKRD